MSRGSTAWRSPNRARSTASISWRSTCGWTVWSPPQAPDCRSRSESQRSIFGDRRARWKDQASPPPRRSQRAEEGDEVVDLDGSESHRERAVVEEHDVAQGGGAAVVEIRRARRQSTQRRYLEAPDVGTPSGHHGPTGIRRADHRV